MCHCRSECVYVSLLSQRSLKFSVFQGFLPTLMLVYVGLNLGVDTEAVTNSFARPRHLRTNGGDAAEDNAARNIELDQLLENNTQPLIANSMRTIVMDTRN